MADEYQTPPSHSGSPQPSSPAKSRRQTLRNQNACDLCRTRKVKCRFPDTSSACSVCIELGVPCTFNKARRRRGPPNKHAEALRNSIAAGELPSADLLPTAGSLGQVVLPGAFPPPPKTLLDSAAVASHWLTLFAPTPTVQHLLREWFEHIHSIAPILHRRRFMQRLRQGDADHDRVFCGLVVSVCAATVATLRRSNYEPVTIQYCVEFVQHHRLLCRGLLETDYSLDWCTAMYNLGSAVSAISVMDSVQAYHMGSESAIGVRHLAYDKLPTMSFLEQQLLKRLFWLLFAWSCSADLFGKITIPMFMCEDTWSQMQPLPVTDEHLDPEASTSGLVADMAPWHGDRVSYVPGLRALSDLFAAWHSSRRGPQPAGPQETQLFLAQHLAAIQDIIDRLPPELRWRGGLSRSRNATTGHDAQIANIFISSLHLKSNLVQKFGPADGSGDEHQLIVDDLLEILYHMPHAVFEANGSSVVPKIRDIGAAYLDQVRTGQNKDAWISNTAKEKLERLLSKLDDLDFWPRAYLGRSPQALE